jgi:tetratricopeptide (TPR) repeat protein
MRSVKSEIPTLFPCWSRRLTLLAAASFFALSSAPAMAKLPPHVVLVENHSDVLVPWIQAKVRGAVVVNVDAHDDCLPITPEQISKLKRLFAAGDVAAIGRANGVADSGLYNIADFITAACALGIAREAVWAAPLPDDLSRVFTHLPFRTWLIDSLSALRLQGPVLLTVDADVVDHFANYRCINLVEAVRRIATTLRALPWDVKHLSVTFSCDGGYLPINIRWIGNAMVEALEGKDLSRPQAPWLTLVKVEDWRRSLLPRDIVKRVRPLVARQPANPWLHVYLCDALFRADSVSSALAEGKKAARLDSGCCRILAEIGGQLASAGRLDEAERFLAAAPAVVNADAEFALAQGLDRAGHTAKAIEHYSRMSKQAANYSADLLIGYGYERLGDTTQARQHYLRAVALLAKPVSEMAGFADLTLSVAAAERFFRTTGDLESAQALRRDHRLVRYFENDKDKSGTAGH